MKKLSILILCVMLATVFSTTLSADSVQSDTSMSNSETTHSQITVEEMSQQKEAVIYGRITNLRTVEDTMVFEAVNIKVLTFIPLALIIYSSGETITVSEYLGFIWPNYALAYGQIEI